MLWINAILRIHLRRTYLIQLSRTLFPTFLFSLNRTDASRQNISEAPYKKTQTRCCKFRLLSLFVFSREERCYVNGRLDGPAKYFYSSGAVETRYRTRAGIISRSKNVDAFHLCLIAFSGSTKTGCCKVRMPHMYL